MCASLLRLFLAPIWVSNCFDGPFITSGLDQQGRAESSDKLYCICVYVNLIDAWFIFVAFDNTFSLSAHHYSKVKCQNATEKRTLVEREVGLATILGIIS